MCMAPRADKTNTGWLEGDGVDVSDLRLAGHGTTQALALACNCW